MTSGQIKYLIVIYVSSYYGFDSTFDKSEEQQTLCYDMTYFWDGIMVKIDIKQNSKSEMD